MHRSPSPNREATTKEQVQETKDRTGVDQVEDSRSSSESKEDMPTLKASIHMIFKKGKKPVGGEDESKEDEDDQCKGQSPRQEAQKKKRLRSLCLRRCPMR